MKQYEARFLSCMYVLSLTLLALFALSGLKTSAAVSAGAEQAHLIILDAGHGGTDGGSSSPNGTRECDINLQITKKTDAVLGLLGENTLLTRTMDTDLADADANTIAQKKITDIHNRVSMVNAHPEAVLVSIHQNTYLESKYYGAQVFYGSIGGSAELAKLLQENLHTAVDPTNDRKAKAVSKEVYLFSHIDTPGILVECGFLTNPAEEEKLKTDAYQKQLAIAIAVSVSNHLTEDSSGV